MPTIREIAEICGVSERAVRKYCERNHIGTYRNLGSVKRRNLSEPDVEALFRHYGVEVPIHRNLSEPASEPIGTTSEPASEPIGTTSEPASEPDVEALFRHYGVEVPIHRNLSEPASEPVSEPIGTTSEPENAPGSVPWEVYEDLRRQLEVKDGQIADLSAALVAAQETAKAAQALHAADKAEVLAIESAEAEKSRWQRLKDAWRGGEKR